MNKPTIIGFNGNTPNEAAFNNTAASVKSQIALNAAVGGKRVKTKKQKQKGKQKQKQKGKQAKTKKGQTKINRKRGGALTVPTITPSYTPTGGPGQTPNDINLTMAKLSTQGEANAQFDNMAGGRRNTKRNRTRTRKRRHSTKRKSGRGHSTKRYNQNKK
jgi:hypothetical protein